jgi:hypothetical protein
MVEPRYLFSLGRPASAPRFYVLVLPIVPIAWLLAGVVIVRGRWRTGWFRVVVILLAYAVALAWLMLSTSALGGLPRPFRMIQFGFRLEAYILLGLSGATIGLMALADRVDHRVASAAVWRWAGAVVTALAVVQGAGQVHQHHLLNAETGDRADPRPYHVGRQQASQYDYEDARQFTSYDNNLLFFRVKGERGERATTSVAASPGTLLVTNLVVMPPLVKITGAAFLGHNYAHLAVLEVTDGAGSGRVRITVSAAHPWPVRLGRWLSLAGLLGLLGNGFVMVAGARRRQRRRAAGHAP